MKRVKVLLLIISVILLSACSNKFHGTWCKYSDVATSLVILNSDISDDQIDRITNYVKTLENLKSYDIIDRIEEATKMITIYYKNEDNIDQIDAQLKKYDGVSKVKSSRVNEIVDKLVVKKEEYIYDKSLNNLSANETKGKYQIDNNTLILENDVKFYYKNKFLCYDEGCNEVLIKAKGNDCG